MSLQENCEQNKMLLKPLVRFIHLLLHPGQTPQMCHAPPLLPAAVFRPWPGDLLLHRRLCLQAIPVLVCHAVLTFPSHPPHNGPLFKKGTSQRRLQTAWTSSFHFPHVCFGFMGCSKSHFSVIFETNGMVLIKHLSQHERSLTVLINWASADVCWVTSLEQHLFVYNSSFPIWYSA